MMSLRLVGTWNQNAPNMSASANVIISKGNNNTAQEAVPADTDFSIHSKLDATIAHQKQKNRTTCHFNRIVTWTVVPDDRASKRPQITGKNEFM
jgi:hypothetical protein